MKKLTYVLILSLVVVSGLVFANRGIKKEASKKPVPRSLSGGEREAELKKWEITPAGIKYKKWEASPEGRKVLADAAKIRKHINDSASMEAVVTALSLPPGSRLGFGVMARVDGVDYIVTFEPAREQYPQLQSLQVNDRLIIKSHGVSFAPKYSYAIVSADYAERSGTIIFKRAPRKGGC